MQLNLVLFTCVAAIFYLVQNNGLRTLTEDLMKEGPVNNVAQNITSGSLGHNGITQGNLREKDSHCMFVVTKLFGNHSPSRMNATLNWYKKITLESIWTASQFSGKHFDYIGAFLWAEGSYATKAQSLKRLGDMNVPGDIHVDSAEGLNHLFPSILQQKSCDIVSMTRIDADDMLSPFAFENIRWAWKNNGCTSTKECAQVAGTKKWTNIVLAPLTDKGQLKCLIASNHGYFSSAGLTVTLPVRILLQHFDDKIVCFGNHVHLFMDISKKMEGLGLQATSKQLLAHSYIPVTPLSGHFNYSNPHNSVYGPLQNCNLGYLITELGEDLGNMIWNAREYIPNLTEEEWKQNGFVKRNNGTVQ